MRFLFDQNTSHRILKIIPEIYAESTTVKNQGLINASVKEIWEHAKKYNYTIVTQDSDFNDLNSFYGFPPKIIWLRMGNLKTTSIVNILVEYTDEINNFINDKNYGYFEILKIKS